MRHGRSRDQHPGPITAARGAEGQGTEGVGHQP